MFEGDESDNGMILQALREEIQKGKGIARIQAGKLLWEMHGKPTRKPTGKDEDEAPITFLIAGPLNDDEIPSNAATITDSPAPSTD